MCLHDLWALGSVSNTIDSVGMEGEDFYLVTMNNLFDLDFSLSFLLRGFFLDAQAGNDTTPAKDVQLKQTLSDAP
jgi:hypothetical protein